MKILKWISVVLLLNCQTAWADSWSEEYVNGHPILETSYDVTVGNILKVGAGVNETTYLYANNGDAALPGLRYNYADNTWEYSNNGTDWTDIGSGGAGGAPTDADYLVGTANGSLSAEIAVGTTPGGEIGGTWASPTIDDSVTVTGWVLGASTATTPAANDADTSLATTAFCETTQDYLKTSEVVTYYGGTNITLTGSTFDLDNPVVANVTGNASGSSGSCTGNAATATNVEGTGVLSTGESGGAKYLREDGDGTCSWQTPSGTTYYGGTDITLTGATFDIDSTVTRDTEWDSVSEINAATADEDFLLQSTTFNGDVTGAYGATVVGNDSHTHGTSTIAGLDISADTNLSAGDFITLTDDDLDVDTAAVSNGETTKVPTCDGVFDFCETTQAYLQAADLVGANETYDATNWDSDTGVPEKDDIRDKLEAMPQTAGNFITLTSTDLDVDALDEDDMVSNSNTQLATQQSIKAYVDANSGAATAFDDIADPDAATTVLFDNDEVISLSTAEDTGAFLTLLSTDADLAGDTILLTLSLQQATDANQYFLQCKDNLADVPAIVFKIGTDGNTTIAGTLGVTGQITGNLTGNVTGNADTVTTNANLTGEVTSVGNAATISDNVEVQSWTLVSPVFTTAITATDLIKDTHIDWGTGAGQVSGADITFAEGDMTDSTIISADIKAGTLVDSDMANDALDPDKLVGDATDDDKIDKDIIEANAGTDITADLEEEVTEGSLADSTIVSADIKNATVAYADMVANVPGLPHAWHIPIGSPDDVVTGSSTLVVIPLTDAALTVTKIEVTTSSASYEIAGDLKYADARIGLANATVINVFDTASGVLSDSSITSGAVAAGKCVYLQFDSVPNAAMTDCGITVYWDYD